MLVLLCGLLAALPLFFFLLKLYVASKYRRFAHIPIVEDPHPFWGNLRFLQSKEHTDERHFLMKYDFPQRGPLVCAHAPFALKTLIYVNDHNMIQQLLKSTNQKTTDLFGTFVPQGLLALNGKEHRWHRSILDPTFNNNYFRSYASTIVGYSNKLLQRVESPEGQPRKIEFLELLTALTLDVIGAAGFGADFKALENPKNQYTEAGNFIINEMVYRLGKPALVWKYLNRSHYKEFLTMEKRFDDVIYSLIQKERNALGKDPNRKPTNMLQVLVHAKDKGRTLTDKEVRDECLTMFIAGHETTANTMATCLFLAAKNQEIQQKIYEELKNTLGDRQPCFDDIDDKIHGPGKTAFPYLYSVFQESLRYFPTIPSFVRVPKTHDARGKPVPPLKLTSKDGKQFEIPHDCIVMINQSGIAWNSEFWDRPDLFRPERFDPKSSSYWKIQAWQCPKCNHKNDALPAGSKGVIRCGSCDTTKPRIDWSPFGSRKRKCLGERFAIKESLLVLATIFQAVHLNLSDMPVRGFTDVTSGPKKTGLWLMASLRKGQEHFPATVVDPSVVQEL